MWVIDHIADLESDFAVFHRIDDPLSLSGPEFLRKATRLSAYSGVMAARVMAARERSTPARRQGGETPRSVSLTQVMATHPDLIERSPRRG